VKQRRFTVRSHGGRDLRHFFFLTAVLMPLAALAQPAPMIIDKNRQDRVQQAPPSTAPVVAQPAPDDRLSKVEPFTLKGVRIQGTSLAPAVMGAATQGFVGKTMDAKAIQAIANAVSDAYANQGDIALYTVTVPEQAFDGGVLVLIVTEGYIQHVDVNGDVDGDVSRVVAMAQKLTAEKPLKRSTLQRYLSLIKDLPGLTVDAQLLKGDAPGAVRLSLGLKQKHYALALNVNNGGNALLGQTQLEADFSIYNLLQEGEETKLSFGTSTLFNRYQYYAASDSEALDDEGTRASLAFGYLHTKVSAIALSGDAETLQLAVSHPLIRSFDENLSVAASVDGIDSTNALLGNLLANEDVRTLRLSGGYSVTDPKSALVLNASASFGLDGLGAKASTGANTGFTKLVLSGQYNHLLGEEFVARLKAVTQIADSRLPISEAYDLGGPDFGRAFLLDTAQGDSALAGSAEIGFLPSGLDGWLKGIELFGFADDGSTWYRARPASSPVDFHLASAGLGIRLPIGEKTRLELEAADAVATNVPGTKTGDWRFLFGLTMRP
jgi:hemolysin activation/secretion protein